MANSIDGLMRPESIAVVGASAQPGKIGYTVVKNIIDSGYTGAVYPVNPSAPEILGLKCYPTINDIPGEVDAAAITVPAKFCPEVVEECGKKGVKGLYIITSGFSEVGNRDLENQIVEIARRYGSRIG